MVRVRRRLALAVASLVIIGNLVGLVLVALGVGHPT
jgi:cytochrome c-type biogenesis protein CcmE